MAESPGPEFLALQGALAGRYSLERELGRGGMGMVFLARDVALDRLVAIKLLPPAQAALPDLRARFLGEARTAAKLSHPNIVPIFAVEEIGAFVLFVMAYVDGETLGDRVRKRGALAPPAAARLLQEVAWALAYAHLRGVVHRDIKPDNILLERETGRALVTDFGIAFAGRPSGLTGVGEILGTAQYMSPEQACGEAVDGRSDLYSLGVVGYYALSTRHPFEAPDTPALLAMHITKPAPPLATVAPGIPGRLAQAIDRCLAKSPDDRFATGEALGEAVALTMAVAKETPTPIRLWMQRGEGARMLIGVWTGFGLFTVAASLAGGHLPNIVQMAVMFGPAAGYGLYRAQYTQRVLSAGYTLADLRLALRERALQEKEELAFESASEPPLIAKLIRKLTFASFGVAAGSGLLLAVLPWSRDWMNMGGVIVGLWTAFGLGTLGTITGAAIGRAVPGRRVAPKDPLKGLRIRVWGGRLGEWFTRIASLGMDRQALPAASAHRPTELAIGLAASALFESLPKETRKGLPDLPDVLRRLEGDAQTMRRRVEELNEALASLGQDSVSGRSAVLAQGVTRRRRRWRISARRRAPTSRPPATRRPDGSRPRWRRSRTCGSTCYASRRAREPGRIVGQPDGSPAARGGDRCSGRGEIGGRARPARRPAR